MTMKKQRVVKILIRFQLIGLIFFCFLTDAFAVTITNGDFSTDPETGWARHISGDGFIDYGPSAYVTYRNMLRIIGDNSLDGTSSTAYVTQNIGAVDGTVGGASGIDIVFDMLRYYSDDLGNYDYPVFIINGTNYRLYNHGNGLGGTENRGTIINNSNYITSSTKMRARVPDSDGADVTIGFGVYSNDGEYGEGELRLDNVTWNYVPTILEQTTSYEIVERQPLELTLDDITATDVESSFPDDFTLTVQDGDNYSVSGNTIVSDTGFSGDLDVPVTASDGDSDSPVFNLAVHVVARPINKDFALNPPSGWDNTTHSITEGDISYGEDASPAGVLQITGDDTGQVDSRVMTIQNLYSFDGEAILSFDLLHYSSSDNEDYDYPFFCYQEGDNEMVYYRLYNLGDGSGGFSGDTGQRIDNDNQVSSTLTFRFPIQPTNGEPVTVGFGVFSADGRSGAGTLQIDNFALEYTELTFTKFPNNRTIAENAQTGALAFSFSGLGDDPVISSSSSIPSLIPEDDDHIVIDCPDQSTDCTINVIPESNQSGSSRITVTVNDGTLSIKDNFIVTVTPDTTAPQLTATLPAADEAEVAADTSLSMKFSKNIQAVAEGDNAIRIYDAATDQLVESYAATAAQVTISNDTLLVDRSGASPLAFSSAYYILVGTAAVEDLTSSRNRFAGITDKDVWAFTIRDNQVPTISAINDQATVENTPMTIGFTVSDAETDAASLTVTATSDNQTLLPDANIVPDGSGGNRTLVLTPATDQFGTANVTVTVSDTGEKRASVGFTLFVTLTDSDGDGTPDRSDGCPTDSGKTDPGACGCGVIDMDNDGDGTADCIDGCPVDPAKIAAGICGCGIPDTDSDSDGVPNCIDNCPADPNKSEAGVCGCGVADTDSDADNTPDCNDGCPADPGKSEAGVCGCGIADTDSDADGVLDCNDGCLADPGKTDPGICGCGTADTDTDGDDTADCVDTDDDNDGLSDDDETQIHGTDPLNADSDGDGLSDGEEVANGTDPLTATGPGIPILIAPQAAAGDIALAASLAVGYGADASAETHASTRWQIGLDEEFTSLAMDVTTERRLLTLTVTDLVLDADTLYYWRVCFTGDDAVARAWSDTGRFTTASDDRGDVDGDRVPDGQEIAADGTITIVPDTETGWRDDLYYLTGADEDGEPFQAGLRLADDGSSLLFFAHQADIPDNCPADPDLGLFGIKIRVPVAGDATTIRLYFDPSPLHDRTGIYKYNTAAGWTNYSGYAQVSDDDTYITVELVDGGYGDADGTSNGIIVDPLGSGTPKVSGGGGGGGGCFIGVLGDR